MANKDCSTAAQGTAHATNDVSTGWVGNEWLGNLAGLANHLRITVGASNTYITAYTAAYVAAVTTN